MSDSRVLGKSTGVIQLQVTGVIYIVWNSVIKNSNKCPQKKESVKSNIGTVVVRGCVY